MKYINTKEELVLAQSVPIRASKVYDNKRRQKTIVIVDAQTTKGFGHHVWMFKPRLILEAFNRHNKYSLTLSTCGEL
jgi:hypothetical protein